MEGTSELILPNLKPAGQKRSPGDQGGPSAKRTMTHEQSRPDTMLPLPSEVAPRWSFLEFPENRPTALNESEEGSTNLSSCLSCSLARGPRLHQTALLSLPLHRCPPPGPTLGALRSAHTAPVQSSWMRPSLSHEPCTRLPSALHNIKLQPIIPGLGYR